MMRDRPHGADLLAEARRVLTDTVPPKLTSETRYQALMVIRAINLAEHELRANSAIEETKLTDQLRWLVANEGTVSELFSTLPKHIRQGDFDAAEDMYAFLRSIVAFKLRETNPSKVKGALED